MSLGQLITYSVNYSQCADMDQIEIDQIMNYAKYEKLNSNDTIILNQVFDGKWNTLKKLTKNFCWYKLSLVKKYEVKILPLKGIDINWKDFKEPSQES